MDEQNALDCLNFVERLCRDVLNAPKRSVDFPQFSENLSVEEDDLSEEFVSFLIADSHNSLRCGTLEGGGGPRVWVLMFLLLGVISVSAIPTFFWGFWGFFVKSLVFLGCRQPGCLVILNGFVV